MEKIMVGVEWYIKREESNAKKINRDMKEQGGKLDATRHRRNQNAILVYEKSTFKSAWKPIEYFTRLNTRKEWILQNSYHSNIIPKPHAPKRDPMESDMDK